MIRIGSRHEYLEFVAMDRSPIVPRWKVTELLIESLGCDVISEIRATLPSLLYFPIKMPPVSCVPARTQSLTILLKAAASKVTVYGAPGLENESGTEFFILHARLCRPAFAGNTRSAFLDSIRPYG